MSTVRINVEPLVISDAVAKSGRSMEDVGNRFRNFDKWLNNELTPTYNQLVELSKYLRVPFGYLLLKTPVVEKMPLLEFRTIDTEAIQHPSRELIDTIHDMERKQDWLRNTIIENGQEPLSYVGMFEYSEKMNYMEITMKIREKLNLNKQWYKNANSRLSTFTILRKTLSNYGIIVMQNGTALNNTHRTLNLDEFRAFTLVDDYCPFIFLNSLDSNNGKVFSLLHEVAHIFFGVNSLFNDDFKYRNKYVNSLEIICNKIAAEIIAPTDLFIEQWEARGNNAWGYYEKVENIADDFRISKLVAARKALDHRYITPEQYNEVSDIVREEFRVSQSKRRNQPGGNPVNNALSRLDENFIRTIMGNIEFGEMPYSEAYRLVGVGRGVFEDVTNRLKGVR